MATKAPQKPTDNAADSLIAKSSKLEVAHQAVLLQDLQALAADDRRKVRKLEALKLFGGVEQTGEEDVGDIIVCDDYTANRNSAPQSNLPKIIMALTGMVAAAGGAAVAANHWSKPAEVKAPASVPSDSQAYDAIYEQQQPDGSWKEIRRERLK